MPRCNSKVAAGAAFMHLLKAHLNVLNRRIAPRCDADLQIHSASLPPEAVSNERLHKRDSTGTGANVHRSSPSEESLRADPDMHYAAGLIYTSFSSWK